MFADGLTDDASVACKLLNGELSVGRPVQQCVDEYRNTIVLGGMHTLFKTRIHPWIDETLEDVQQCVYDPVCNHEDGVCHACLYMSEVACESANASLDRRYIVGDDFGRVPAFWETEYV